jgi:hypothetical protein
MIIELLKVIGALLFFTFLFRFTRLLFSSVVPRLRKLADSLAFGEEVEGGSSTVGSEKIEPTEQGRRSFLGSEDRMLDQG